MTDQGAAFVVILMDALAHRRDYRHTASGELLETLLASCLGELQADGKNISGWHVWLAGMGVELRPRVPARYVRRANHQVSAEHEAFIRDLLARGWNKTTAQFLRAGLKPLEAIAPALALSAQTCRLTRC
jgi:hypothetical protein